MKSRTTIVDVFVITGRGTVFTGTVLEGVLELLDTLRIGDQDYVVTGIERFINALGKPAIAGDNIGVLLRGATKEELDKYKGTEAIGLDGNEEDDSAEDEAGTTSES